MEKEDLNGWCRNCDNREECKHLNLPSCEEFMFRTDGEDFDSTGFVVVERKVCEGVIIMSDIGKGIKNTTKKSHYISFRRHNDRITRETQFRSNLCG